MQKKINPRILYVDEKDCCQMIGLMLYQEEPDFELVGVSTTEKAFNLIACEKFDLFIFEHELPDISGINLCREIRQNDAEIPILFFTQMARNIDRKIAMEAGATKYLVKPTDLNILVETIRKLLKKSPEKSNLSFSNTSNF